MAHPNDKRPHCKDCGIGGIVHPWRRTDQPDLQIFVWLCGSCKYKRDHPDTIPMPAVRKPKVPQKETLLDCL